MVNDINKLAELIRENSMPLWLHEYLNKHRAQMKAELKLFGQCEIPMPDGGSIYIEAKNV